MKIKTFIFLGILISFFSACSSSQHIMQPLPLNLAGVTLSKELQGTPATSFSTEDEGIIANLRIENLWGEHNIRWDWYDPTGKLYYSVDKTLKTKEGKFHRQAYTWHKLSLKGDRAEELEGNWRVDVYFDGRNYASKTFTLEEGVEGLFVTAKPNPKNWGLIIGIENYASLPSVSYAENDAVTVKEYFVKAIGVPEENIIFLINERATKATIEGYLQDYLPKNVDAGTNLYVYFAGHGAPDVENRDIYLVPHDGNTRFIAKSGYNLRDFYNDIDKLDIQKAYVFLDACFSGGASRGKEMLTAGARPLIIDIPDIVVSGKVVSLTASSGGQISNSYPDKKHGLFTYFLLRGLKGLADADGDSWVTMGELYGFVKGNVSKVARREGVEQTPCVRPDLKDIESLRVIEVKK